MENIRDFLFSIGFGKNEAEVYVALVEIGQSSVLDLAKRTKMHRSNIYDALRSLLQKGLVYEVGQPTKLFYAREPSSLLSYMKYRETELIAILKSHESKMSSYRNAESTIKISKGIFAVREALYSLLPKGNSIEVYGIPLLAVELIGPTLREFHKERIKHKIIMKHIYNSEAVERVRYLNKLKYTEAKVLPPKYDSYATTIVAGSKVIIFLWGKEINVIEIEDENMARPYKNYFDILWSKARAV